MDDPSTIKSQIEYGLDTVGDDRTITVPLKDLLYVYQTIGELIRFFHQPAHYPSLENITQFLGSVDAPGAFASLHESYYDKLYSCWPEDISDKFDRGEFDNPITPFYYKPLDEAEP